VSRITLSPAAGNILAGSRLTIYGLGGAPQAAPSGVTLIERVVLGADGTIGFSNIPDIYEDLLIVFCGQAAGGSDVGLALQFNGDNSTNYDDNRVVGVGTTAAAGGNNAQTLMYIAEMTRVGNTDRPGSAEIRIPSYARTIYHKACHSSFSDLRGGDAGNRISGQAGGLWRSTAAITDILLLTSAAGDLEAGAVASLYGYA
jgi:hypothetical protein